MVSDHKTYLKPTVIKWLWADRSMEKRESRNRSHIYNQSIFEDRQKQFNEKTLTYSTNCSGTKLDEQCKKTTTTTTKNFDWCLISHWKNNPKQILL